jgi:hypothetical protein
MEDTPQPSPPTPPWKGGLIIGPAIGLGIVAGKVVDAALLPSFGYWGAFATSILVASLTAFAVAWVASRMIRGLCM